MTLQTKASLKTEVGTDAATNGTGAITAALLRTMLDDIIDSYCDWTATGSLIFTSTGVNFNSANSDNSIAITLPTGYTRYMVDSVTISNASHTLVTATFGLFSAASGGGIAIIAGGTAITVSATADATANNAQKTTGSTTVAFVQATEGSVFFRVGTAEGSTATADVTVVVRPLP